MKRAHWLVLLLGIVALGAGSVIILSGRVDEVFDGDITILAQRPLQLNDIDQQLLFPTARVQSLITQNIRLHQATLEREYHQDTYRMTTTDSPERILAYYQTTLLAAGWNYVCAPRAIDGPPIRRLDATCTVVSGPFAANWKAQALFDIPEQNTHLNIIIYPPAGDERVVEVIKIAVYKMAAFDSFTP
jgi:hypothetical protein